MIFLCLAALLVLPVATRGAAEEDPWNDKLAQGERAVVEVNGEAITGQEVYALVMRRYARQTVAEMIQRLLVEQEARKEGVTVTPAEIEERYEEVRKSVVEDAREKATARGEDAKKLDADAVFLEWVYRTYLGPREFRHHLRTNLLSEKIVARTVAVADKDMVAVRGRVLTYSFARHKPQEAQKLAEDARRKAAAGADFAALARERSEDDLARGGGAIPEFRTGAVYLPIEPAAAVALVKLKPGQVSEVIRGRYGCSVLKLEALKPASALDPLAREELRQRMLRERVQANLQHWLAGVKERAKVEFRDRRFE